MSEKSLGQVLAEVYKSLAGPEGKAYEPGDIVESRWNDYMRPSETAKWENGQPGTVVRSNEDDTAVQHGPESSRYQTDAAQQAWLEDTGHELAHPVGERIYNTEDLIPTVKRLADGLKSGFSGTKKDSLGRVICFRNGLHIPCPQDQGIEPPEQQQEYTPEHDGGLFTVTPNPNQAPPTPTPAQGVLQAAFERVTGVLQGCSIAPDIVQDIVEILMGLPDEELMALQERLLAKGEEDKVQIALKVQEMGIPTTEELMDGVKSLKAFRAGDRVRPVVLRNTGSYEELNPNALEDTNEQYEVIASGREELEDGTPLSRTLVRDALNPSGMYMGETNDYQLHSDHAPETDMGHDWNGKTLSGVLSDIKGWLEGKALRHGDEVVIADPKTANVTDRQEEDHPYMRGRTGVVQESYGADSANPSYYDVRIDTPTGPGNNFYFRQENVAVRPKPENSEEQKRLRPGVTQPGDQVLYHLPEGNYEDDRQKASASSVTYEMPLPFMEGYHIIDVPPGTYQNPANDGRRDARDRELTDPHESRKAFQANLGDRVVVRQDQTEEQYNEGKAPERSGAYDRVGHTGDDLHYVNLDTGEQYLAADFEMGHDKYLKAVRMYYRKAADFDRRLYASQEEADREAAEIRQINDREQRDVTGHPLDRQRIRSPETAGTFLHGRNPESRARQIAGADPENWGELVEPNPTKAFDPMMHATQEDADREAEAVQLRQISDPGGIGWRTSTPELQESDGGPPAYVEPDVARGGRILLGTMKSLFTKKTLHAPRIKSGEAPWTQYQKIRPANEQSQDRQTDPRGRFVVLNNPKNKLEFTQYDNEDTTPIGREEVADMVNTTSKEIQEQRQRHGLDHKTLAAPQIKAAGKPSHREPSGLGQTFLSGSMGPELSEITKRDLDETNSSEEDWSRVRAERAAALAARIAGQGGQKSQSFEDHARSTQREGEVFSEDKAKVESERGQRFSEALTENPAYNEIIDGPAYTREHMADWDNFENRYRGENPQGGQ